MSDLTVLLLILLTEMINKHNYAFMQRKDGLHYTRDDFSPAFTHACVHYYEWWPGRTVFSWNKKCSPLSQKIQTSLLCSKGGEDLQSLSWCKVLTVLPEHQTENDLCGCPKLPLSHIKLPVFSLVLLFSIIHTGDTHFKDRFKLRI